MTHKHLQARPFLPIFLTVFFGFIGLTLPYPIFSPMLLYPENSILPEATSFETRMVLLGILLALYPFGQFFGLPLIGRISDFFGRKKILICSLLLTACAYFFMAMGVLKQNLLMLMISRFICGFSEGNVVIAQAAAADLSQGHKKVQSFSIISLAISLGFIIGPIVGGQLSTPKVVPWFNYATPFWFSILITIITLTTVIIFFPASIAKSPQEKKEIASKLFSLQGTLSVPKLPFLYFISFLSYLGMLIFLIFLPVYQAQKFSSSPVGIANMQAYAAVFISSIQLVLAVFLSKKFHPFIWKGRALFFMVIFLVIFLIPQSLESFFLTLPPICICIGIAMTSINVAISNCAEAKDQGTVMGVNGSIIVAAETISAFLGGILSGFLPFLPFIFAACILLLAATLMFIRRKAYLT